MYCLLFILTVHFISAQYLWLNPATKLPVQINEEMKILKRPDEGFYDNADIIKVKNQYVVYERADKRLTVFDRNGKQIRQFGREGRGPGELDGWGAIYSVDDHIILVNNMSLQIFDLNGQIIYENRKLKQTHKSTIPGKNGFYFYYHESDDIDFIYERFDKNGNKTADLLKTDHSQDGQRLSRPYPMNPRRFGDFLIRGYTEEYKFEVLDQSMNLIRTYRRDYDRIKGKKTVIITGGSDPEKNKKRAAARMEKLNKKYPYKTDIKQVIGAYQDKYLLISTAVENNNEISLDIIDADFKLRAIFTHKFNDQVKWFDILGDQLSICFTSDEIGIYFVIYDLIIG